MPTLTEKVLQFQDTHEGLSDLLNEISPRIYAFPKKALQRDEDAPGDFYLFFYPRLLRLLDRFEYQGKPFEVYLQSVLNWQFKNFLHTRWYQETTWDTMTWIEPGEGYSLPETNEDDTSCIQTSLLQSQAKEILKTRADRRNFLLLLLKCPETIDAVTAPALAEATNQSPETLLSLREALHDNCQPHETRREVFRARRNKAFSKTRILENTLQRESDPHRRAILNAGLTLTRWRMTTAVHKLSKIAQSPSNRQIANILNIPKGTVDSGLYWIKRKLTQVEQRQASPSI
jgi:RNA polymerase sigma factor (sigma-70 family)